MLSFLKDLFGKTEKIKVPRKAVEVAYEQQTGNVEEVPKELKKGKNTIETTLSLHPSWEKELDEEQKYVLQFIHSKLPKIKEAIFFHPFHVETLSDGYRMTLFVRNGLDKNLRLTKAPLTFINDEKIVASGIFEFTDMGEIPAHASRPWVIEFKGDQVFQQGIKKFKGWGIKVAYKKPIRIKPNLLQLTTEWDKKLTKEQKDGLLKLMDKMPPVPLNRVEFVPIEIRLTSKKEIVATLLIRNGYAAEIQFKNTPLLLLDREKGHIASGIFNLEGLSVSPGASMPWNFYFSRENIINDDFDPTKVEVIHGAKQIN